MIKATEQQTAYERIEAFHKDLGKLSQLLEYIRHEHRDLIRDEELLGRYYRREIFDFDLSTLRAGIVCYRRLEELEELINNEE